MEHDPKVIVYFNKVLDILPKHKHFQPSEKHLEGKPRALEKCRKAIELFLEGGVTALSSLPRPQASLEFILSLCNGKDIPPKIEIPRKELRPIVKNIRSILKVDHYTKPDKEGGIPIDFRRIPRGQKPFTF